MPVARIPKLDALRAALRDVGGTHELTIRGLDGESRAKLAHLARTGRPFLELGTPHVRAQLTSMLRAEVQAAVRRGDMRTVRVASAVAAALHAVVEMRFRLQGNDVALRPLEPATRAAKARAGLDPRIGIATGDLYAAVRRATFGLRKVR